jgi:hypothetical protein
MKEQFKNAMAYCAAVASFAAGTYVVGSGVVSIIDSRTSAAVSAAAASNSSENGLSLSQGFRKLFSPRN